VSAMFSELRSAGLIAVDGADAGAFLHAQLTSDIAGLPRLRTQYSGYCSPKGRLLATFLVWRTDDTFFLQLPTSLYQDVQSRLSKYVLRSKVKLADATADYRLFGVWGSDAPDALAGIPEIVPEALHDLVAARDCYVTRLAAGRFVIVVPAEGADAARAVLAPRALELPENAWARLEIESGIPVITRETQEQFVPQMVNLDLIGAVSYAKGCYPGQEIVARMHYLGRLKQRMYRVHIASAIAPAAGEPLFSDAFGRDQASGTIVNAASTENGHDALAVIQMSAIAGAVHWKSPDGPAAELKPLPYSVPD
jgi:tRNA-modifying protein YgfZ